MPAATVADVEARLGRSLDESEVQRATTLLSDVEVIIRRRVADLTTLDQDALVMVEATAVARVLRNPDGIREQNAEGFGYTLDPTVAGGRLRLLAEEWADLGLGRRYAAVPMKFREGTNAPPVW